MFKVNILRCP